MNTDPRSVVLIFAALLLAGPTQAYPPEWPFAIAVTPQAQTAVCSDPSAHCKSSNAPCCQHGTEDASDTLRLLNPPMGPGDQHDRWVSDCFEEYNPCRVNLMDFQFNGDPALIVSRDAAVVTLSSQYKCRAATDKLVCERKP